MIENDRCENKYTFWYGSNYGIPYDMQVINILFDSNIYRTISLREFSSFFFFFWWLYLCSLENLEWRGIRCVFGIYKSNKAKMFFCLSFSSFLYLRRNILHVRAESDLYTVLVPPDQLIKSWHVMPGSVLALFFYIFLRLKLGILFTMYTCCFYSSENNLIPSLSNLNDDLFDSLY